MLANMFNIDLSKQFIKLFATQTNNKMDFPSENVKDITEHVINQVVTFKGKHILVFLPYPSPMVKLKENLETRFGDEIEVMLVMTKNFDSVKKDLLSTPPKQRVIISTNILESGITLDYLDVVVDPGYELTAKFNPYLNANVITMFDLAPKDKIIQRNGRVG